MPNASFVYAVREFFVVLACKEDRPLPLQLEPVANVLGSLLAQIDLGDLLPEDVVPLDIVIDQMVGDVVGVGFIVGIDRGRIEEVIPATDRQSIGKIFIELGFLVEGVRAVALELADGRHHSAKHRVTTVCLHLEVLGTRDQPQQIAVAFGAFATPACPGWRGDLLADFLERIGEFVPGGLGARKFGHGILLASRGDASMRDSRGLGNPREQSGRHPSIRASIQGIKAIACRGPSSTHP